MTWQRWFNGKGNRDPGAQSYFRRFVSEACGQRCSRPDMILADLGLLRDGAGRLFINQFCESSSIAGIPVTVMSAGWTGEDVEQVKRNSACEYLEKPVRLDKLSDLIQTYGQS